LAQALGTLATRHVDLLRGYGSYLANVLDHLEGFGNAQLQQVFSMFAALTARQPAAVAAAAAVAAGRAGASGSGAGARGFRQLQELWQLLLAWLEKVNACITACMSQQQ
jgi:hypothetical protein